MTTPSPTAKTGFRPKNLYEAGREIARLESIIAQTGGQPPASQPTPAISPPAPIAPQLSEPASNASTKVPGSLPDLSGMPPKVLAGLLEQKTLKELHGLLSLENSKDRKSQDRRVVQALYEEIKSR